MNFNLKCEEFKQQIIDIIESSELPPSVIYYIFQSLYTGIEQTYIATIRQQREKEKEEKEKENSNQN